MALRFANLGFREAAMTITGLPMKVVGRDATPMLGRDGTDTSYTTDTLNIGPGESYDVLFTAPAHYRRAGPRHLPALQPRLHALGQPGAGWVRRPDDGDPRLSRGHGRTAGLPEPLGGRSGMRIHATTLMLQDPRRRPAVIVLLLALLATSAATLGRGPATAAEPPPRRPQRTSASSAPRGSAVTRPTPIFNLTTKTGYISLPDGNTAFMWGYSSGSDDLPAPGTGALRERGRHRHRHPPQHLRGASVGRLPRAERRAGRRLCRRGPSGTRPAGSPR